MRDRYENESRPRRPKRWGSAGLGCAQRLLAGLLVLGGVTQCPLRAQTNASKAAHAPDRYLLVVETSKSMQRRADAVLGSVGDLLGSGLNGQFRDGGTLGVWTFNRGLSAGIFPLQTWSASAQKDITQRTITFLKGQKYGQRANFDEVAPALSRIIEASEAIIVILISSGDVKIRGTPFDDRINAAYLPFREQQQKTRMPFVTVLRARQGQFVDYIVNMPPWPLQVPRWPEETKSVEAPRGKPSEALQNAPPTTVPPLIVSGKKPKPEPAVVSKPEPAAAKAEPLPPVVAGTVTNEPAVVERPEPAASPAEVARVEPAPVVPAKPAAKPIAKPVPEPKPASEPKTETVKAPEAQVTEPAPVKRAPVPPPPAPAPKPEPALAKAEPLPPVVAATVAKEPAQAKRPEPAVPRIEVARVEPTPPSPAPEVKTGAAPAPATIPGALPAVTPSVAAGQATTSNSSSLTPPLASRPAPSAQSATAAPGESLRRTRNLWIASVLLAVVAVGFAFLLARRSRPAPQGSLITRSFERKQGP